MSKIKATNTGLELKIRKNFHKIGLRYRLKNDLLGKPDLLFPKKHIAVFINGCFWHQHNCPKAKRPITNTAFWNTKLDNNIKRDKYVAKTLKEQGWKVIRIWQCKAANLKYINRIAKRIKES